MLGDEMVKPLLWGLNAISLRQKTTAQNIANANTPGYKRQMVTFQRALDDQMGDEMGVGDPPGAPMPQSGPEWDLGIQYAKSDFEFDQLWGAGKKNVAPFKGEEPAVPFSVSVVTDPGAMRVDGNGVAIEREIGDMNKNTGNYNLLATRASGEFKILTQILQAR
jgi:flagellar basal body rod protein FlgB